MDNKDLETHEDKQKKHLATSYYRGKGIERNKAEASGKQNTGSFIDIQTLFDAAPATSDFSNTGLSQETKERVLQRLQNQRAIGAAYLLGTFENISVIAQKDGTPQYLLKDTSSVNINEQEIILGSIMNEGNFSAALLRDTNLLLLGKQIRTAIKNPEFESERGFLPLETVRIALAHELTHFKFHNLPQSERLSLIAPYTAHWEIFKPFASTLMNDENYRKTFLTLTAQAMTSDQNVTTIPVHLNDGRTFDILPELIIDELFAYGSAATIIGEHRLSELDPAEPLNIITKQAHDGLQQLQNSYGSNQLPHTSLYTNIHTNVAAMLEATKQLMGH